MVFQEQDHRRLGNLLYLDWILSVEVAGEDLEQVWVGEPQVGEEVLLRQAYGVHVPEGKQLDASFNLWQGW